VEYRIERVIRGKSFEEAFDIGQDDIQVIVRPDLRLDMNFNTASIGGNVFCSKGNFV
jgi:hypothetical protein